MKITLNYCNIKHFKVCHMACDIGWLRNSSELNCYIKQLFRKFVQNLSMSCDIVHILKKWAKSWENLSWGVCNKVRLKLACPATEGSKSLWISEIANLDIILSTYRTTKALIRLHGCAVWSVPLLFAYGINFFSQCGSNAKCYEFSILYYSFLQLDPGSMYCLFQWVHVVLLITLSVEEIRWVFGDNLGTV